MSNLREIQTIHKISEVLAEAFSKVKFISQDYLNSQRHQEKITKNKSQVNPKKSPILNLEHKDKPQIEIKPKLKPESHEKQSQKKNVNEVVNEHKESKNQQKKRKQHEKKDVHPDRPKKPVPPFFRFSQQNMNKVKEEYPDLSHAQVTSVIGQIWNQMEPQQKGTYEDIYKEQMKVYELHMRDFYLRHPEERTNKMKKQAKKNKE